MPRTLSSAIQAQIALPSSYVVHLLTFAVNGTHYYFGEELIHNFLSATWLAHLLLDSPITYNQTLQAKPATVKLQNVSLEMAAILKTLQSDIQGVEATLYRFWPAVNDYIELLDGIITQMNVDENTVALTIDSDLDPTSSQVPKRNFSQLCTWKFKDPNCGYVNGVDWNDPGTGLPYALCNKTFLDCTARGRIQRYPGFIYLTARLTQAVQGQGPEIVQPQTLSSVLTTPWEGGIEP